MEINDILKDGNYASDHEVDDLLARNILDFVMSQKAPKGTLTEAGLATAVSNLIRSLARWSIHTLAENEYYYSFNRSLLYINENLSRPLTLREVAKVAGFSGFYYHRLFHHALRETLAGYIRRLRLEKAAFDVLMTAHPLDEIAVDAGYADRGSLAKSFKKQFGYSLAALRKKALGEIKCLDPRKYIKVHPSIKKLGPYTLLYTRIINALSDPASYSGTWQSIVDFAQTGGHAHGGAAYLNVVKDCPVITPLDKVRVFACISGVSGVKPYSVFRSINRSGGLYAVFPYEGRYEDVRKIYTYIYRKWIYEVGYEIRDTSFMEKFARPPVKKTTGDTHVEIYIPIK